LNFSTNPFWKLPVAGAGMIALGVTGSVAVKMLPVMKTELEVAAMAVTAMRSLPVKVTKRGFKLASNLAMKELIAVPVRMGKAAPEVAVRALEVVVPVM
jgi:hypothetical protein